MVRIKNRYLLINILYPDAADASSKKSSAPNQLPDMIQFNRPTPDDLSPQLFLRAIKDHVSLLYGDYGVGVTSGGLSVKYLSPATSTAIVRCSRNHYRLVWAALSYMTQLPNSKQNTVSRPCVFQVVRVSGTIRKSEEEAIRRARAAISRAKRDTTTGLQAILGEPDESLVSAVHGRGVGIEDTDDEDDDGNG